MSNESSTQSKSFYLQHALKDSIGGQRIMHAEAAVSVEPSAGITGNASAPPLLRSLELDPSGLQANTPGAKLDAGKIDVYRGGIAYFPRALEAIARVSEKGARKYSWKGWEKVANGVVRYTAAMMRHILKEDREEIDPDTMEPHIAQTAWNAMARLELYLRDKEEAVKNVS